MEYHEGFRAGVGSGGSFILKIVSGLYDEVMFEKKFGLG